ncbi:MAG: hypothetical protein KKE02_12225 [Alphaproteobacteria bacterium]|nr:hypothetical protein [Alphaproteobacteria bacterium]MBU1514041.1 hypothetical protein [Alphaproteobacteria bacterium]MBU2093019.1 hypothetical protein [Alphaproteobacteria bacterium]MBU2151778.1 hypothetical protein [Alphaproteobacteria bacterium]MBU2309402.1 hypothetical protein [Alphaproteobacteria bacterium]
MLDADPRSQMLFQMGQCAYRLGMAFGAAAEGAGTHAERLEHFQLFERCSFAARMSIALELRLRRETRAEARGGAYAEAREHEDEARDERDPPETERYTETDWERERESVSLPLLLSTLNSIAVDAQALRGPPPAELPTLRELLARVKSDAAPTSKPQAARLRTRLAASATAPVPGTFALASSAPPPAGRHGLTLRRATGPPR